MQEGNRDTRRYAPLAGAVISVLWMGNLAAQTIRQPLAGTDIARAATEIDVPDTVQGEGIQVVEDSASWKIAWTNTFRYSAMFRITDQDAALINTPGKNSVNYDDGDSNFDRGLVSNRLDVLSELDAVYGDRFGVRLSGAGWYDQAYNSHNDNPGFAGGAAPNQTSVSQDQFVHTTRRLHGRDVEVRDAFVFGKFGDAHPTTARLGQHSVVWGESLFFAANAIAGAQNPFDVARLQADPTAQAKEFVLPVPQVSAQTQFGGVTVASYYQFAWRSNRFPAVGSYFSTSDTFGSGAEHMWVDNGVYVDRRDDIEPDDGGQGGLRVRFNAWNTDFGIYALRFHDKTPQLVTTVGFALDETGPSAVPNGFVETFHQDTRLLGVSASHTFGNANVAIEASIRDHASLASSGGAVDVSEYLAGLKSFLTQAGDPSAAFIPVLPSSDNQDHPAYAVGKTAHVNLNTIWTPSPNALFEESTITAELAWNRMLSCDENCVSIDGTTPSALDPNGTRDGVGMRVVFTPTYRQALSGLDLNVPFGASYAPKNSRPLAVGPGILPAAGGGDITLGLSGIYNNTWNISLQYTHFYGPADTLLSSDYAEASAPPFTWGQTLRDRDFVSFNVRRSF